MVRLALLAAIALPAVLPPAAGADTVKHVGALLQKDVADDDGCQRTTLFEWSELPGATSYTVLIDDTLGFYGVPLTYPPYDAESEGPFGGLEPVAKGQHRQALTYQAGPSCAGAANDLERFSIKSFTATFDDKARIVGTVTEDDGTPVSGVKISIKGPSASSEKTNAGGAYGTTVKKGRYNVAVEKGYCLRGGGGKCERSKTVEVKGTESVHFVRGDETVKLSGTLYTMRLDDCLIVNQQLCFGSLQPKAGAVVEAVGQPTASAGPVRYEATANASGAWSMKVKPGRYAISAGDAETPVVRNVNATGARRGLDFCPNDTDWAGRCEVRTLRGTVEDIDGRPYKPALVHWPPVEDTRTPYGDVDRVEGDKGRFELLVPERGSVRILARSTTESFLQFGAVSLAGKKVTYKDQPVLRLKPSMYGHFDVPGGVVADGFTAEVDGLPLRREDFTLKLKLIGKPSAIDPCTFKRKMKFVGGQDDGGYDPLLSRHQAYLEVGVSLGEFCAGLYTVEVSDADGETLLRERVLRRQVTRDTPRRRGHDWQIPGLP